MKNFKIHLLCSLLFLGNTLIGQTSQPNVIVILADDMGWNDVGYHGSEIKTPTLDRLAAEGVELNNYYVQPACTPTRSSMMTGKAALRLGIVAPLYKNAEKGLPLSETIMPQFFKQNNYQTWLVGKWHLGRFKKEYWPYNRGFDHFYGYLTGGVGHYDHVHGGGLDWQRNGETIREEGYTTHLLTKETLQLVEGRQKDKPFFLELCYAAPHLPNEAPEAAAAEYQHLPNKKRGLHAAMVTEVDRSIQQLYEALEKEGILDNTIIWFSSDNGGLNAPPAVRKNHLVVQMAEKWGRPLPQKFYEFERDNIENGASDNRPLKGGKRTVYQGGVRVPALIYAPKFLPQRKVESRITITDVLPTLANAAGFKDFNFKERDGVSQWDFLTGKTKQPTIPDFIIQARGNYAYYKDNWKLILPVGKSPELYDLSKDPTEQNNVAKQHPQRVENLTKAIEVFPRGELVNVPMEQHRIDPDFFGGKEDRAPWAGLEGRNIAKIVAANDNHSATKSAKETPSIPIMLLAPLGVLIFFAGWFANGFRLKK